MCLTPTRPSPFLVSCNSCTVLLLSLLLLLLLLLLLYIYIIYIDIISIFASWPFHVQLLHHYDPSLLQAWLANLAEGSRALALFVKKR